MSVDGVYLCTLIERCRDIDIPGWSKTIWDLTPVAWLVQPDWLPSVLAPRLGLTDRFRWVPPAETDPAGALRVLTSANRNEVFRDFFARLARHETEPQ
jgi:hypothetical protein